MGSCRYEIENFMEELGIACEEGTDLFSTYIQEMGKLVVEIERTYDGNEMENLGKALHSIKGLAGNFYISDVQEEAIAFEILLKERAEIDINFHKDNLIRRIEDAEEEIKQFFTDKNIEL